MTAQRTPPTEALLRAAKALRFALIVQGTVRWLALSAGALLGLLLLDNLLHLPEALRLPLAVVFFGFVGMEGWRKVLRPALQPLSPSRAARLLEMNRGIGGNVLINAYQFERDQPGAGWKGYVGSTLDSSSSILAEIPPRSLWLTPLLKKWLLCFAVFTAAWLLMMTVFPRYVTTGIERIFLPLADIPPVGTWSIEVEPHGRVVLVQGDKLDVTVHLKSELGDSVTPPSPTLNWQEDSRGESSGDESEHASMNPGGHPGEFVFSFNAVSQPFHFRVSAADSRSAAVQVEVLPLPQVKGSSFQITPPPYTGLSASAQPGPPATLEVPAGSTVKTMVELSAASSKVLWREGKDTRDLAQNGAGWELTRLVDESIHYEVLAALPKQSNPRVVVQGQITAVPDHPPAIDFVTEDRNRAVNPGDIIPVTLRATDDYGVSSISLQMASSNDPETTTVLKTWSYLGPPGQKEPTPETYSLTLDPAVFTPGTTFLLTAMAGDFYPAGHKTISRPIILRVTSMKDLAVPQGDPLEKLFDLLKAVIALQTSANGLTDNLALHLSEALAANDLAKHTGAMSATQKRAQDAGVAAIDEAGKQESAKATQAQLQTLVKGEMGLALDQISKLPGAAPATLSAGLGDLQKRQAYILDQLISMLGQMASARQEAAAAQAKKQQADAPLTATVEQQLGQLKDELKAFGDQQKRIVDATKAIKELNPEDLTSDQQAVIGDLAREEAKQASFFQEKLTDLSKLPLQDFADGKLVQDMNEVYQEVQASTDSLYQKRTELAVPSEQAGLEKAAQIEQNLERWLPNSPDHTKWSMEEPPATSDIPMAELPKQLDDLIGDLLNKEEDMDKQMDDVSSSIMDSSDKGAGWGAADGPMSNMSAKGVTGNQLPNNDEISGRSGEGRNGKSDGQMVGDTATGKGGRETPTRMTPTPFENGSVNDQSKDTKGGATGGGKLAGTGQDGLRGPLPPLAQQRLRNVADQQSKLRQQAESLALQLRKQRRPTGDLESAVNAMQQLETAAQNQNGLGIVQGYHQALDSLRAARSIYAGSHLSRVEADALGHDVRKDVNDTQAEDVPAGYEEMTGAYFRSLSEAPAAIPDPPSHP